MTAVVRRVTGAAALLIALSAPGLAQTTSPPAPVPTVAFGMTLPEYQGVGCLVSGTAAGAGVFAYSDVITVAATGMLNPVLLIPVIATGFAVGCGVGATVSPAFLWIGKAFS
jgi:hypothetical protein